MTAPFRLDRTRFAKALETLPGHYPAFIDGKPAEAADGRVIERVSPAHGAVVSRIEAKAELIATLDVLESGEPIAQARAEIAGAVDIWRYAAGLGRELGRNAALDYTEEKTLHLHTGPRSAWWVPKGTNSAVSFRGERSENPEPMNTE